MYNRLTVQVVLELKELIKSCVVVWEGREKLTMREGARTQQHEFRRIG